jgi:hypothetical protein
MAGDNGLSDLRFDGWDHNELADEIDRLRQGPGAGSLHRAVDALQKISNALEETDRVLRDELGKIGVHWEGEAAVGGTEATKTAAVYAEEAAPAVAQSADGVSVQGETFSTTRNQAPESGDLRGPTKLDGFDRFAGTFGYTTDNAKKVEETKAAHQAAVSTMNSYSTGSASALNSYQSLPVPPNMGLVATPYQGPGTTSAQSFNVSSSRYTPSGAPPAPGTPGNTSVPPGGQTYTGLPNNNTSVNPISGGSQQVGGTPYNNPNVPTGGNPALPGRGSLVGPVGPNFGGLPGTGGFPPGVRPGLPAGMIGDIAAVAGVAGSGAGGAAAGSSLEKDKVVRGGHPDTPEGRAARAAARGAGPIAPLPDDEARAARNAEKIGAKPTKSGQSMMSPAASSAQGEDDGEHVRKYGIDSDDVFGDERMVIMPVLGTETD